MKHQTHRYLLGKQKLHGSGSGGDPQIGKISVEESISDIRNILKGTDILFIIAGLGKGTGSGASPEIARIAREMGILTIAIVNFPSINAEGKHVYKNALENFENLKNEIDSVTIISNDKIIKNNKQHVLSFMDAFNKANNEVKNNVSEIITIVNDASEMNIDFADVRKFFKQHNAFVVSVLNIPNDYTKDTLTNLIKTNMEHSYSDIQIDENCKDALINLQISAATPTSIVADIRSIFRKITNNNDLSVTFGIDYSGGNEIKMCYLLSASNQIDTQSRSSMEESYNAIKSEDKVEDFFANVELNIEQYKTGKITTATSGGVVKDSFNIEDLTRSATSEPLNSAEAMKLITKAINGVIKTDDHVETTHNNQINKN
jgi:cell division protein FtsZ